MAKSFFLEIKLKSNPFFQDLLLKQKISFLANLRKYVRIMTNSFFLMISIIVRVFSWNFMCRNPLTKRNCWEEASTSSLFNVCHDLFFQEETTNIFWSYSLKLVVHLLNRLPSPFLDNQSRYEFVYSIKPDFSNLKVFSCLAYASSTSIGRTKLDSRNWKCVFPWL